MRSLLLLLVFAGVSVADELDDLRRPAKGHPLAAALRFCNARQKHLENVSKCSYRLVKRERIDGQLQAYRHCDVTVSTAPLRIDMEYLAPPSMKGRQLLFIDGQNNNRIKVVKGGRRFAYITFDMSMDGATARGESFYTIRELSLLSVVKELAYDCRYLMKHDPEGKSVVVDVDTGQIEGRPCTVLRIRHLKKYPEVIPQVSRIHIDDTLQLPVRFVAHDWDGNLLGEFTYLDVELK
jgi:hypothetical protein